MLLVLGEVALPDSDDAAAERGDVFESLAPDSSHATDLGRVGAAPASFSVFLRPARDACFQTAYKREWLTNPQTYEELRLGYAMVGDARIRAQWPVTVLSHQYMMTGRTMEASRSIETPNGVGRTELFRITPDGVVSQH